MTKADRHMLDSAMSLILRDAKALRYFVVTLAKSIVGSL